ncbi:MULTISPECIES: hypothetical protein [Catenuloplanes]|uniref:Uncharacterized protein n=1 Tax=Catenuloplanes niger TaxID=587534 RepID=A0AAE3ZH37_9ACTN|nr:hypothetical protein [Catenuloplanes niger]MDR7319773.1 hypothetical protein [Catenuloplanes niger]
MVALQELAPVVVTGVCGVRADVPDQRRQRAQRRTERAGRRPDGRDSAATEQPHVMP